MPSPGLLAEPAVNIRSRSSRLRQGLLRVAGLPGDPEQRAPAPNAARRKPGVGQSQTAWPGTERSGRTRRGSSRKPSAITPGGGSAEQVLHDQPEAFPAEPAECLEHGLGRPADPPLVHVHGRERGHERAVRGGAAAAVIRHHVVGRVQAQAVPGRQPPGDGRLARPAPAADPVDAAEPGPQRFGPRPLRLAVRVRRVQAGLPATACAGPRSRRAARSGRADMSATATLAAP